MPRGTITQHHFKSQIFGVSEFCRDAQVRVCQGGRVLHQQRFRRLSPNQSARLSSTWLASADPVGEALHVMVG